MNLSCSLLYFLTSYVFKLGVIDLFQIFRILAMDENNVVPVHKKRRHDNHYQTSDYHPRYKKYNLPSQREDWRSGGNFRNKDRYSDRQDRNRGGNQYSRDSEWDVELNLIGVMDSSPMVHLCDTCRLPIRSYGRLIPCKHVFCFKCAKKTDKNCPRCAEEVHRIEQCRHGTVWMCSVVNCSRTYLSQRDLQAHINHRHNKPPPPPSLPAITVPPPHIPSAILVPPPPVSSIPQQVAPYVLMPNTSQPPPSILPQSSEPTMQTSQDRVVRPSSNLITIQIQDNPSQPTGAPPTSASVSQWSSSHSNGRSNY